LWEWANTDKLNSNLLLAKNDDKNTVLYHASLSGNVQVVLRIKKCPKEQLKSKDLNTFLLAQDNQKYNALHVAAQRGNVGVLDKVWEWAKEVINTDKLNNNPLFVKDYEGNTVLQHA